MTESVELHIFTNSTIRASSDLIDVIKKTYTSFQEVFKVNLKPIVWCDPNPNIEASANYINELKKIFPDVRVSKSLIDGYLQAVTSSNSDYLFMLEHDWRILPTITIPLDVIISEMKENELWYLIFHKFNNFDKFHPNKRLEERHGRRMSFCLTNRVSNNPHIIYRKKYLEQALTYINVNALGSNGLEAELTKSPLTAAFYGSLSQAATVKHLNGR
jgi:hypothetical protein